MKHLFKIITISLLVFASCTTKVSVETNTQEFYQLKTFSFATNSQIKLADNYLKNAFLPALKRNNIENIGVFKTRLSETDTISKIYVLIPFSNLNEFESLETTLLNDKIYLNDGTDFLNVSHENPAFSRMTSILIRAFRDMPKMEASILESDRKGRIYELRSYESSSEAYYQNKVEMFNEGGEVTLFKKLNFNAVFYGEVISGPKMPNLMYMTTHANQESRDANWKAFVDAPEWKKMSSLPKYQKNVSHIDIDFLYPTEYSDY